MQILGAKHWKSGFPACINTSEYAYTHQLPSVLPAVFDEQTQKILLSLSDTYVPKGWP